MEDILYVTVFQHQNRTRYCPVGKISVHKKNQRAVEHFKEIHLIFSNKFNITFLTIRAGC